MNENHDDEGGQADNDEGDGDDDRAGTTQRQVPVER